MKKILLTLIASLFLLLQPVMPYPAYSDEPPNRSYQMISWMLEATEGSAITVRYKGSDGIPHRETFPIPYSMVKDHANDPTWMGLNSAAPFLAYVKEFGIDRNVRAIFCEAEYFDPVLLEALKGQGVSLNQFGVSNPKVGEPVIPETAKKNIVGLGIPAWFGSTSTKPTAPAPTPKPEPVTEPKPEPTPSPTPKQETTQPVSNTQPPSIGTPKPESNKQDTPVDDSGIDPERVNPTREGSLSLPYEQTTPEEPKTPDSPLPYVAGGAAVIAVGGVTAKILVTKKGLGSIFKLFK